MSRGRPSPTLLVFTLGPSADRLRRPLLPGRWGDLERDLRQACLAAAVAAGREAGCRVEISSPQSPDRLGLSGLGEIDGEVRCSPQEGRHFGARLDGALRSLFAGEDAPVLVVGSDVPDLTAGHVRRALELLEDEPDRVVVGPSPDGGFYLLAARRPIEGLASGVSWCCRRTLATLERLLEKAGRELVRLSPLADLDRPADLERWLEGGAAPGKPLRRVWRSVVEAVARLLAWLRRPRVAGPAGDLAGGAVLCPSPRGPPIAAEPCRGPIRS